MGIPGTFISHPEFENVGVPTGGTWGWGHLIIEYGVIKWKKTDQETM